MKTKTISVVVLKPGMLSQIVDIDATLQSYQELVGGNIEICDLEPFEEYVSIVCNEEGKMNGLPLNRAIRRGNEIIDIIAGNCFICDSSGEHLDSLSEEQLKRFSEQFKYPEQFFRVNGELKAAPYKPE